MITEKKLIQDQAIRATMKVSAKFWNLNTGGSSSSGHSVPVGREDPGIHKWLLMLLDTR